MLNYQRVFLKIKNKILSRQVRGRVWPAYTQAYPQGKKNTFDFYRFYCGCWYIEIFDFYRSTQ